MEIAERRVGVCSRWALVGLGDGVAGRAMDLGKSQTPLEALYILTGPGGPGGPGVGQRG